MGPSVAATPEWRHPSAPRGNHVLDVVGVAGTIHVSVVPVGRLVLHVRGGDGDAALALFWRVVDRVERAEHDLGLCFCNTLVMAAVNVVFP